ncbi:MAG: C/D box methylation guide ribonucleoprotein complex aNOP56 subunit [Candidatus Bathyarchaeota archaeon]
MRAIIIESSIGVLAFNDKHKFVMAALFPKKPERAARILNKIQTGNLEEPVTQILQKLRESGYDKYAFINSTLAKSVQRGLHVDVEIVSSELVEELCQNVEELALRTKFSKNSEEFRRWMQTIATETTKLKVKAAVEKRDLIVIQAIQSLDDLDKTINLFMNRLREWYGIHFPELDRLLDKHETYARLVYKLGKRQNFQPEILEKENISEGKVKMIAQASKKSMGAELEEEDFTQLKKLCKSVLDMFQLRQTLEDYINITMDQVAPNIKIIGGALLGARLIALAGGLSNLAKKPASTIQVLGAEKALFRALKTGSKPPKHGIIFQHNLIHEANTWQRGKISRALAGKLAIAARADAFGTEYIGEDLKASLEKRVEDIINNFSQPPLKKEGKKRRDASKG